MDIQVVAVNQLNSVSSQIKENTVDCDLILPDYYPEISKILDCRVRLSEEAVTVTADKISIAGIAAIWLLYTAEDGVLKVYESACKYTKLVPGTDIDSGDTNIISQTVTALNYRAVSPRKIEVKIDAAVRVNTLRLEKRELISDICDDRVQKRIVEKEGYRITSFSCLKVDFENEISLPAPKENISGILNKSVCVIVHEVKAADNKVMLSGTAEISFTYITADNNISNECSISLPFTQIKEVFGISESDRCDISIRNADIGIDMKSEINGDNEANAVIHAEFELITGRETAYAYIDDAYAVNGILKEEKKRLKVCSGIRQITDQIDLSGEIPFYDIKISKIYDRRITDISYTTRWNDNTLLLSGSVNLKLLVQTEDSTYYCFSRNCSFEHQILFDAEVQYCSIVVASTTLNAEKGNGDSLQFKGSMRMNIVSVQGWEAEYLASAEIIPDDLVSDNEKIVLYYGEKGESLWKIAKENRTTLQTLSELNDVNSDLLTENKLLVFPV